MREFVYYSSKARTSGNFSDLMRAGRIDIACHVVIAAFFISNAVRQDVVLHLVFSGPPDPPKHIMFTSEATALMSKKDVAGLLKRVLFRYNKKKQGLQRVFKGCYIEKKDLLGLARELQQQGKKLMVLDRKGTDIRKIDTASLQKAVFLLGDAEGFGKHRKLLKKIGAYAVSVGPAEYFASQVVVLVQNELDRRINKNF